MKCPIETQENAEVLLAYCARRLDAETTVLLERHLAGCPACREFQKNQEAVWQALDAWEAMPVSADFDRRLYQRIDQEEAHLSWWDRLMRPLRPMMAPVWMGRSVPVAAAACLLVLAGVILQRPDGVVVPEPIASDPRIESIQPDQVERTLDDMEMLRQFRVITAADTGTVNSM
jgi:anti-sigma factor RsiW